MFELFDPSGDLRITQGHLPHWYQTGVTYFITFRTADSIPVDLAELWYRRRNDWLLRHGTDPVQERWQGRVNTLNEAQQREYHDTFTREYLDQGYGECVTGQC